MNTLNSLSKKSGAKQFALGNTIRDGFCHLRVTGKLISRAWRVRPKSYSLRTLSSWSDKALLFSNLEDGNEGGEEYQNGTHLALVASVFSTT
jgi:hypothetical protein